MDDDTVRWEAPGEGGWMLESVHFGAEPLTPCVRSLYAESFEGGIGELFARYGMPLERIEVRFVNGYEYARPIPAGSGGKARPAPPGPVMWLLVRAHPELRRRNRAARRAFAERLWREDIRRWREEVRPRQLDRNLALQDEDPEALDDESLADHLERAVENCADALHLHFSQKFDIPVMGDLLAHTGRWGIPTEDVLGLLRGSSPASSETVEILRPAIDAVRSSGRSPATLEEVRGLSDDAAAAVDEYLRLFGTRVVTSYDASGRTLSEMPEVALKSVLAAVDADGSVREGPDLATVRDRVPAGERDRFDGLLEEARLAYAIRDDNTGMCGTWPVGLLRRALLVAGDRLRGRGALEDPSHVFDARVEETVGLLRGAETPARSELAARVEERSRYAAQEPPPFLGSEPDPPPMDVFPSSLRRTGEAAMVFLDAMIGNTQEKAHLEGHGVGEASYRGRARVVRSAADALESLETGDVLVAPYTSPAYNTVLPMCGAIACQEGGGLSHAAILARELGIPAVVGAPGLLDEVADGDEVEVDPVAGRIRVLQRAE